MGQITQPRGVRNNNPLNIKRSSQVFLGETTNIYETTFKTFKSVVWGFRAAICIIRTYIMLKDCKTPYAIIHRWCPDETADRYTVFVCRKVGIDPNQEINFAQRTIIVALVSAMAIFETGVTFDNTIINDAYQKAIDLRS